MRTKPSLLTTSIVSPVFCSQLSGRAASKDVTMYPVKYWKCQQNIASVYGVGANVYYAINVTVHFRLTFQGKANAEAC